MPWTVLPANRFVSVPVNVVSPQPFVLMSPFLAEIQGCGWRCLRGSVRPGEVLMHEGVSARWSPAQIVTLLESIAAADPAVLSEPAPKARLMKFGSKHDGYNLSFSIADPHGWFGDRQSQVGDLPALRRSGDGSPGLMGNGAMNSRAIQAPDPAPGPCWSGRTESRTWIPWQPGW